MINDNLGDRMKGNYENCFRFVLPKFMPVIIRLDGVAFHTFTKGMNKPFDRKLMCNMQGTAYYLCTKIHGAVMAYVQSDEISILVYPYNSFDSQEWYGNNLQKLVSVSASMASVEMSYLESGSFGHGIGSQTVLFDSRAFVLPIEEVNNYFVWRQKDWYRNSVNMIAQSMFSQKELTGCNVDKVRQMIFDKDCTMSWDVQSNDIRNGCAIVKVFNEVSGRYEWKIDIDGTPDFVENKDYIQYRLDKIIVHRESNGYMDDVSLEINGYGPDMTIFDEIDNQ